jgi:D-amino-acid dehydrogenase
LVEMMTSRTPRLPNGSIDKDVVLGGSGIVNLITAYYLVTHGYSVRIFDQEPDPRTRPDWRLLGCSASGGNCRVFSLNEARHHFLNSRHYEGEVSSPFKRTIAEDGSLAVPLGSLTERDHQWNERFESVTRALATRFHEDVVSFNKESEPLWREMIAAHPLLFQKSGYIPGLFRVYATAEKFARAQVAEKALGAIKRILNADEIARELPALREAVATNAVAGVMEVTGFSVGIHSLVEQMINHLSAQGVEFQWQVKIDAIVRDSSGRVKGLKAGSQTIEATHYVMSMGAYSQELFAGFSVANAIAPMIGLWLTIPNLTPQLDHPFKLSRAGFASKGAGEGANVVPGIDREGRPVIHISSGHGYIGFGNEARRFKDVMGLGRSVEETVRSIFPKVRTLADGREIESGEDKLACVRPWTATGLGIFESTGTERDGSFIIAAGHNTGGFAQSPAVATAVLAAIEGRAHPMHGIYHPERLERELRSR